MKHVVRVAASVAFLAGCNKGPSIELHNATGNQVAAAVKHSGIMSNDPMIEPGLWQAKVTVEEMNIPGLPAQYAAKVKETMAEHRNEESTHCVTPAEVKKPKEGFFGADKSCRYEHFTMGAGRMDIQMVCKEGESSQTTSMSGTYTPTSYSMDMSSNGTGAGMQGGMTMKLHVDSRRIGDCSGKEG